MIENKTILITGGAGFIGINLLRQLVHNNRIIIMDNFNDFYKGKKDRLVNIVYRHPEIQQNVQIISLDICNYSSFNFIKEPIDIIIHLAAYANVRHSVNNSWLITDNNFRGTLNVLKYMMEKNIKRLIFTSSSAVYGNPIKVPIPEEHNLNPISPYGVCKCLEEDLLQWFTSSYEKYITILRLSTVYGTHGRKDMVINGFLDKILKNQEIVVFGDSSQIRDFVYIDDVINAIITTIETRISSGQIINIGSGQSTQVRDLLVYLTEITDIIPYVRFLSKHKADVLNNTFNIEKAKKLLNYEPKTNIYSGLKKTYNWNKIVELTKIKNNKKEE